MDSRAPSTGPLRAQHADLMAELGRLEALLEELLSPDGADAGEIMTSVVDFVKLQVRPRAQWEEAVLYEAIDRLLGPADLPFTATMRREHELVGAWVQQLDAIRAELPPRKRRFALIAAGMLAFIRAHFQVQEDVLLPILDRNLTSDQFLHQILSTQTADLR